MAESAKAQGIEENKSAGKAGGKVAKRARLDYEKNTGKKVITDGNFLPSKKKELLK
jgi:hypothetical protein